jgi:DNA mismatch repair protein MutS2
VRELEARGREILDELRRRPDPATLRTFVGEAREAIVARTRETAPPETPQRAPVPGDLVEVVGRGIRGELVEVAGERARILRGGLRFEVAADQLRVVGEAPVRERIAVAVDRPTDVPEEINLIGQRAREAVDALSAFLDRALRAGVAEVRDLLGVGSGALRRAVHELLAATPYCAEYHDADPPAGGAGVTIARLS